MTGTIKLKGFAEVVSALERLDKLQNLTAVLLAAAEHIRGVAATYPPETIANSPSNPSGRWYERGYGRRWRRKDGSLGGRKTSQMLGRQWHVRPLNATSVVVGNRVTYGPFVQDEEHQAWFHRQRGWKTVQQVAKEEEAAVVEAVSTYLEKELTTIRQIG